MKRSKGFTILELIATIGVMAVIVLIAVPAYTSIRKRVLESQYKNLVSLVETTAKKYGASTKERITNVQALIDTGLLETDDGTYIYDPRDNSVMNCYAIEIDYENGNYNAKLLSDYKDEDGKCDLNKAKSDYSSVKIIAYDSQERNSSINLEEWHKGNIYLYTAEEYSNYNWLTSTGKVSTDEYLTLESQTIYDGLVSVQTIDAEGNNLFGISNVKIDNQPPVINEVKVKWEKEWNKNKNIDIKATDGNGSGIAGYYIGEKECNTLTAEEWQTTDSESYKYSLEISKSDLSEGKNYHVCAKDSVGNIGEYKETIYLTNKDTTPPQCKVTHRGTIKKGWYTGDVTLTVNTSDDFSGVKNYEVKLDNNDIMMSNGSYVIKKEKYEGTINVKVTVHDNAENIGECSGEIKIDNKPPTCSITAKGTMGTDNWYSSNVEFNVTKDDKGSGISKTVTPSNITSNKAQKTYTATVTDNAGNMETCSIKVGVDKTAPTCSLSVTASEVKLHKSD